MTKNQFLKSFLFELDRAERAYNLYKNDSVYLHAKNIHKANASIINLISDNSFFLDGDIRSKSLDLLEHLDVWMEQFEHLEKNLHPEIKSEFIFERFKDTKPFPNDIRKLLRKEIQE